MRARRFWTSDELAALRQLYPDTKTEKLAVKFGRPTYSVYNKAQQLGIRKSAEFLASADACRLRRGDNVGAAFRYPKGHVPMNKGIRQPGWGPGRMKETQFKPGARSGMAARNWMPIGAERLIDGYRYRKVSDIPNVPYTRNWKLVSVLLWEKHRGKIPPAHALIFRNGDRTDIRLGNLKLVPRSELMRRNSVHRLPKALKQVVMLRARLVRKIRRLSA